MSNPSNAVFLSYRRDAAGIYVLAVYQHLDAHHIDAFYDIESIKAGQFGEIILGQIAARPYFMPVLTPGTLPRCVDPGDWVRREIEYALSLNRMLVPLHTPDFEFADLDKYLPHIAEKIKAFNMVELPTKQLKYFKYAIQDVVENYLKPISITLATVSPIEAVEVARTKQELSATPAVSETALSAQEYFNRGTARYDQEDYYGAIADYDEAIRLNPDDAAARYNRGIAWHAQGDYDMAIANYNEAICVNPDDPDIYLSRAAARQNKQDYDGAITDYSEVIRLNPGTTVAYINRAEAYHSNGDYDRAIADYDEAIRLNPDDPSAYYKRAVARRSNGDYDGAIADYTENIRLKPNNAWAYHNRGLLRDANGDTSGCAADYQHALDINPNLPQKESMRHYITEHGRG